MKLNLKNFPWKWLRTGLGIGILVSLGGSYSVWWPKLSTWIDKVLIEHRNVAAEDGGHADHDDGGETVAHGDSVATSLAVSSQARNNLGLTAEFLRPIELSTYRRMLSVPAVVIAKPGRTEIQVSSPLTGVVMRVHAVTGEAVTPGELLFDIRLSFEDLVESQTMFLRALGELDVEKREIARLESVTLSGAISGKVLLERKYAKEKLEAQIRSQREALKSHGLSDRQVDTIATDGKLLRDLQIVAPDIDHQGDREELRLSRNPAHPVALRTNQSASTISVVKKSLIMEDLRVSKGQAVMAGDKLCSLSDFTELYIEGQAFEQDSAALGRVVERGWSVDAIFPGAEGDQTVRGLKLAFVGNSINVTTRTLAFFVELPNVVLRDDTQTEARFVSWKYRPGQRLQLQVPVEEWTDQIVLPVDSVVKDGADWFVFQQNGTHFDRVPVHVRHRDPSAVVIANDGSVYPGDVIALKSAHQMQMAIKNKSGGGADPHAGHTH